MALFLQKFSSTHRNYFFSSREYLVIHSMKSISQGHGKKWFALFALVIQNSLLSILMRYTLVVGQDSSRYMTSTAVLMSEVLKLLLSLTACFAIDASANFSKFRSVLKTDAGVGSDWLKLCVPSVLYTLQNSLQYAAMARLSAPVFQVLYQMKIITTAIFSVLMLSRQISGMQWFSILALTLGVGAVQFSQQTNADENENSVLGLVYVLCGCATSGFAGVYFEMVLKASKASIWLRNIQLSFIGIFVASLGCLYRDYDRIVADGFFCGYDNVVWSVIAAQAAGGLLVAMVVKYADNVIKNFATSVSIIASAVISARLFHDVAINIAFVCGSLVVLGAVYAFGASQPVKVATRQDMLMDEIENENPGTKSRM